MTARRVTIMGTGLIGGSIGLALRAEGWTVSAVDADPKVAIRAVELGAADCVGLDPASDLVVLAGPVGVIASLAETALAETNAVITDVGSTKGEICAAVDDPRFIGGHPMAGSEQDGIDGARADLFAGAMWVLTPTDHTDQASLSVVAAMVRVLGAEVIALAPEVHDRLVAQVSHVPHLTAAALMTLASETSVEHRALLRLAAGGFRDMTRISAGRPSIWPDICMANAPAILDGLDGLIAKLADVRAKVADGDRVGLLDLLTSARQSRINLPTGFRVSDQVAEVAVPIPDRPGEIAAIATLASELDVNILDLDITHSGEGQRGVMLLMVDRALAERLIGGLMVRGYQPVLRELE